MGILLLPNACFQTVMHSSDQNNTNSLTMK